MAGSSRHSGLTRFMCAILAPDMTTERLKAMNIEKTAKHFGISQDDVAWERVYQLKMRGAKQ